MGGGYIFAFRQPIIQNSFINNLILTTMINGLFKKPKKATRVCRVENIDPRNNIVAEMHTDDQKEYKVCLCIAGKETRTTFPSEYKALNHISSYGIIYGKK